MGFEAEKAVSWLGFFKALFGVNSTSALILGGMMVSGTIVVISWIWFVGGRRADLSHQIGLAAPCLLLIPPHAYYYDAGLIFFTYAVLVTKHLKHQTELVGIVWLLGFSQILSGLIGFSPLFFVTVFTSGLAIYHLWGMTIHPKYIKSILIFKIN